MSSVAPSESETLTVELAGELTIRSITELRERLLEALRTGRAVVARIADDAATDLTFVQLIEATRRSAQAAGQAFALAGPATGPLLETLRRAGMLSAAAPAQTEFWLTPTGEQ